MVLFIACLFHPLHDLPIEIFLNGDVCNGCGRRSAVPMPFSRWKPYHVARTNFFNRAAFALNASTTGSDNQSLAERMRVPSCACARLKRDTCAGYARWIPFASHVDHATGIAELRVPQAINASATAQKTCPTARRPSVTAPKAIGSPLIKR